MKRLIFALVAIIAASLAVYASDAKGPQITFERTKVDFGTVKSKNGPVSFDYKFTNTGDKPLIIVTVTNGGCGCTKPTFPKAPIQPGESSKITIHFNPDGRSGEVNREVKVRTNIGRNKTYKLKFNGVIIPSK